MGHSSYYSSKQACKERELAQTNEANRVSDARKKIAAKIVMAVVDKIIGDIVRPGPHPEERECYEMAGELRAIVPDLEAVAKKIIDVEDGVK